MSNTHLNRITELRRSALPVLVAISAAVAIYLSLKGSSINESVSDHRLHAAKIRAQSVQAPKDAFPQPKKVLTPEEIESGKW